MQNIIFFFKIKKGRFYIVRMTDGRETWHRLLEWDKGQAPSERLAAIILHNEGFQNIDPSHPLGGKDGLKDMALSHGGKRWIGGVYFPRGQQTFSDIKSKFIKDIEGVEINDAQGFVFVTNQELRLSERKILVEIDNKVDVQIYHLERIASLLNTPLYYGVRMEFLNVEMTIEEQLGFFSIHSQKIERIENILEKIVIALDSDKTLKHDYEDDDYFDKPKTIEEIADMVNEFCDKVWFNRHLNLLYRVE